MIFEEVYVMVKSDDLFSIPMGIFSINYRVLIKR